MNKVSVKKYHTMFDGGLLIILFKESLGQPSIVIDNLITSIDFLWPKTLDKVIVALT